MNQGTEGKAILKAAGIKTREKNIGEKRKRKMRYLTFRTEKKRKNKIGAAGGFVKTSLEVFITNELSDASESCLIVQDTRRVRIKIEGSKRNEPEMEVLNVDVLVRRSLALAPKQQALFGCHFLDGDVLDGEAQDDGPDHTQSHFRVAVNDFCPIGNTRQRWKIEQIN